MTRLNVRHLTTYRYANPVRLGDHRLMIRPRDSHDLRLIDATLAISPQPTMIRWLYDVQGNSVAIASFDCTATELRFESNVKFDHFMAAAPDYALDDAARTYPFAYLDSELPDLIGPMTRRHHEAEVAEWARQFLDAGNGFDTL